MVNEKNYITIQGWMVSELGLAKNELLCYALIYGFSQDGESVFSGSSKYICNWLNISQPTALDTLKNLCEKGLIQKIEKTVNGCRLCDYKIILDPLKKFKWGTKETLVHNIEDNNNITKKEIYKERKSPIQEAMDVWVGYKKERKQKYTNSGLKLCQARLAKLSNNDPDLAMQIVEQSIGNNWSGLFALKEDPVRPVAQQKGKIVDENFYIDEEYLPQFKETIVRMSEESKERLYTWFQQNKYGQLVDMGFVGQMISKFFQPKEVIRPNPETLPTLSDFRHLIERRAG